MDRTAARIANSAALPGRALVPQHLQPRALDQGAGDRGHAQGDPRRRGHRRSAREGHPSDREAAWASPEPRPELVEMAVEETLAYYAFPDEHWRRIRTNNPLERIFVHSVAMMMAGGFSAWLVYRYLGLKFASRSWFNLDTTWAVSLILVGALSLAIILANEH
jgi:hypothetical protein